MAGLALGSLFLLILLQVPIGFAMIAVGVAALGLLIGWMPAATFLAKEPAAVLQSSDLATIPLFLMMGAFASLAGFSQDMYAAASACIGHRRGGLAQATLAGGAAFGSICGSSIATTAALTRVALPEMERRNYEVGFSSGTIAAVGALKSLIPPSLLMILYCVIAKTFIFDMFIAAVIPAALTIVLSAIAIWITVRLNPSRAPIVQRVPWRERLTLFHRAIPAAFLMALVFAGLYSGVFTVNEAASVAAVLSFCFAVIRRQLTWVRFQNAVCEASVGTLLIYTILIGANVFSSFVGLIRAPEMLVGFVSNLNVAPIVVIAALLLMYLVLGTVFDEVSALVITLPIVLPIVIGLGYDPIWWGIMCVIQIELAVIHPPFGVVVFVLHGLAPHVPMKSIYRGVLPFLLTDFIVLIVLALYPDLTLVLLRLLER